MPRTRNSFASCMVQDIDPNRQSPNSYRHALNGRVRFIEPADSNLSFEEKTKLGNTLAFTNDKGNIKIVSLCPNYIICGSVEVQNELIIFSTNGINSEIGVLTIVEAKPTPVATYKTLFNDKNDPNNDRLSFSSLSQYSIEAEISIESNEIRRIYWVDGKNELRCANLELFYSNKTTRTPYHNTQTCGATITYPKALSVHQMSANADITLGKIKYQSRISGSLLSGTYQLFYQLITEDGHHSNVSPLTKPLMHHAEAIVTENHHKVRMGASGITTPYGIQFTIQGIDTRWSYIRVGYAFSATDAIAEEIVFFTRRPIMGAYMTFDLTKNGGQSITQTYLNARTQWPLNPQTLGIFRQKLFVGGFKLPNQPQATLTNFNIQPTFRLMDADQTAMPQFATENDPITNTTPQTNTVVTIQNFVGNTETYTIANDYANYKGIQFSHLFDGWWRGAPADLGIVVFDRKGNPLFVQPLPAYTTPEQYQNAHLTALQNNRYHLRIMGLSLSGITFNHNDIFDQNGKLLISGFSIVRLRKQSPIRFQGVVVPAVRGSDLKNSTVRRKNSNFFNNLFENAEKQAKYLLLSTQSLPIWKNRFEPNYQIDGLRYAPGLTNDLSEPYSNFTTRDYFHEPYTFTIHAPDVMVEEAFPTPTETHRLKAVAGAHAAIPATPVREIAQNRNQYYTKNYKTGEVTSETKLGSETRLSLAIYHDEFEKTYLKYDVDRKDQPEHYFHTITAADIVANGQFRANLLATRSVIAKAKDWRHVDVIDPTNDTDSSLLIVNYIIPDGLNQGSTNLEAQEYDSIGHFQPITQTILNQTARTTNAQGEPVTYTFNGIELYGGGCYTNFIDFTRLYPLWMKTNDNDSDVDIGYGLSHIVPLESKYNFAMRYGRTFAANASQARLTLQNQNLKRFWNGIMRQQPEDWNINSCLLNNTKINRYYPQVPNTTLRFDLPTGILWTNPKILNETDDTYRKLLPANISDVDGAMGPITGFGKLFDYLYIFQTEGYSRARIDERAALANVNGENVYLGTGEAFAGADYISRTHGMTYRNTLGKLRNALYFLDIAQGCLNRHSQAGHEKLSDLYARHDTFTEACKLLSYASPQIPKIIIQGDELHNDVYICLQLPNGNYLSTIFNEDLNAFTADINFQPRILAKLNRYLLAVPMAKGNDIYLHHYGKRGQYFGVYYPTILQFVIQAETLKANYFDNLLLHINKEGHTKIKTIRIASHNPAGQAHTLTRATDNRIKYLEGSLRLPLRQNTHTKGPLLAEAILITIEIANDPQSTQVVISAADVDFRPSFRQ